jgi:thiol-disulfide isomerase/thioredoxin
LPEPEAVLKRRTTLLVAAVLVSGVALAGGIYVRGLLESAAPPMIVVKPTVTETGDMGRRPDFTLPDEQGVPRGISEWDGKVVVLNFWATWCPPCLHEIPMFMEVQESYAGRGVQFLGVAIDDLDNVKEFTRRVGLNYPTLHGQVAAIQVSQAYGNTQGGLPYTVVIDRQGNIAARHAGALTEARIREILGRLL